MKFKIGFPEKVTGTFGIGVPLHVKRPERVPLQLICITSSKSMVGLSHGGQMTRIDWGVVLTTMPPTVVVAVNIMVSSTPLNGRRVAVYSPLTPVVAGLGLTTTLPEEL